MVEKIAHSIFIHFNFITLNCSRLNPFDFKSENKNKTCFLNFYNKLLTFIHIINISYSKLIFYNTLDSGTSSYLICTKYLYWHQRKLQYLTF